jgi:hypothetical protein
MKYWWHSLHGCPCSVRGNDLLWCFLYVYAEINLVLTTSEEFKWLIPQPPNFLYGHISVKWPWPRPPGKSGHKKSLGLGERKMFIGMKAGKAR